LKKQVVSAGGGDFESALGNLQAADVGKFRAEVRILRDSGGGPGEGLAHDQVLDRLSECREGCQGKLPDKGS